LDHLVTREHSLLGLCVCVRRRRNGDGGPHVAGQPRHPYRDIGRSKSEKSFTSKDVAGSLQASPVMRSAGGGGGGGGGGYATTPTLLYPHGHSAARQSSTSVYSQGGDESPLTDYFDSPVTSPDPAYTGHGGFVALPPSPPRTAPSAAPVTSNTRSFHLPTSASASPYVSPPKTSLNKSDYRADWL
jgi:hypothetical protein